MGKIERISKVKLHNIEKTVTKSAKKIAETNLDVKDVKDNIPADDQRDITVYLRFDSDESIEEFFKDYAKVAALDRLLRDLPTTDKMPVVAILQILSRRYIACHIWDGRRVK
jgi:hypothetical protein